MNNKLKKGTLRVIDGEKILFLPCKELNYHPKMKIKRRA